MHENGYNDDVEAAEHLLNETKVEVQQDGGASSSRSAGRTPPTLYTHHLDSWLPLKYVASLALLVLFSLIALESVYPIHATSPKAETPVPTTTISNTAITATAAGDIGTSSPSDVGPAEETASQQNDRFVLDTNWNYNAPPQKREYNWTITDVELNPDGVYRPMIVINGQFPGPLVEVNDGDTISVTVKNEATNSTSLHWHGLFQNGTNHMDGTVGITQCPIAPGTTFVYEFQIQGQSGTYWYHAHHAVQASDGLYGPLIIHSKDESDVRESQGISYASDQVVMVSDHYYDLSSSLLYQYLQPDRENIEPVPASALINGRGVRDCDTVPSRKCDNSTLGVGAPVFNLEAGKSHRLRIINAGSFAEFQVQLDEHEFATIEADGTDLQPRTYHRLNISPAQRYSIVITANNTMGDAFWLRARMVEHCFKEPNAELSAELHSIVRYTNGTTQAPAPTPNSRDWPEAIEVQCRDMNTTELEPVIANPPPPNANHQMFVRANFEIGAWRLSRGFFNASSWRANVTSPVLFRYLDGAKSDDAAFVDPFRVNDSGEIPKPGKDIIVPTEKATAGVNDQAFNSDHELIYQTSGIQVIDILVSNFDDGSHPLHLHGHKFWVFAGGKGYPPEQLSAPSNLNFDLGDEFPGTGPSHPPKIPGINLKNPLYRDTATVEGFGWVLLRFIADNPGLWAFHCHISWHAEAGLLMPFLIRGDELRSLDVPQEMRNMCKAKNVQSGTSPDDSVWFGSFPEKT